jgi:hypothetical protein
MVNKEQFTQMLDFEVHKVAKKMAQKHGYTVKQEQDYENGTVSLQVMSSEEKEGNHA